jgi:hypothetical protein
MPRRSILSAAERESLLALPDSKDDLIRHYTFSETDLSIIRQRRGASESAGLRRAALLPALSWRHTGR